MMNCMIEPINKTFKIEPEPEFQLWEAHLKKSVGSTGEGVGMFGRCL